VGLGGKPFTIHVSNGDKVKKGQLLLEADLQAIREAGLPVIAPMVICNSEDFSAIDPLFAESVTNDDSVLRLTK
jgi:PTS system beta-glucosides-specific IIC component